MLGADPVLRTHDPAQLRLAVVYDERPVPASGRDTLSAALLRAGVVATSRSLKFRRPRGPFCLQGDCGTCLVRVDGQPNLRACTTAVIDGMRVAPQNRMLAGAPDPTALVDHMFAGGMDHHHLMLRPKLVNRVMQEVARNLAGLGTLPDAPAPPVRSEHHRPDVLVVGGGRSARAAAEPLRAAGLDVVVVERFDAAWTAARGGATAGVTHDTAVFGIYPAEGYVAALARTGQPHVLHTWTPRHLIIATGARDVMLPLANNDLPGVFAARGLLTLLARTGDVLAGPAVLIGAGVAAAALGERLGATVVAPDDVRAILGGARVEAVATARGKLEARAVALAAPPAPAAELARQAGARVRFNGDGFAVERDERGRCGEGPWTLWACGEVCGVAPEHAEADGHRVARAVLAQLAGEGAGRP